MVPTVEDTYTANIFTERNCLEQLRLFDTAGLVCSQLTRCVVGVLSDFYYIPTFLNKMCHVRHVYVVFF